MRFTIIITVVIIVIAGVAVVSRWEFIKYGEM